MSGLGNIVVALDLDGRGFSSKISIAKKDLHDFARVVGAASQKVEHQTGVVHTWGRTLRDTFIVLGLAKAAFSNLISVITVLPKAIINASAEIERMKMLMMGMSFETKNVADAMQDATDTVKRLFEISSKSPFEIGAITDTYVKLKSAGLDPLKGALQGLIDSVAKFGGSSENLKRAAIAIQQMAGKGVISMEELRQQLGESVPNAMRIMARATGMSMAKMVKVISQGRLEAQTALRAFTRQMIAEDAGAADSLAKTWIGSMNRLKNAWTLFLSQLGAAGVFKSFEEQLNALIKNLQTNVEFQRIGKDIGEAFAGLAQTVRELLGLLYEMRGVIGLFTTLLRVVEQVTDKIYGMRDAVVLLVQAWAVLKIGNIFKPGLVHLLQATKAINLQTGAVKAMTAAYAASKVELLGSTSSFKGWSTTAIVAGKAISGLRGAAVGLGVAVRSVAVGIGSLLGPFNLLLLAVWGAYEAYQALTRAKREFNDTLKTDATLIDKSGRDILRKNIKDINNEIVEGKKHIDNLTNIYGSMENLQKKIDASAGRERQRLEARLEAWRGFIKKNDDLAKQIEKSQQKIKDSLTASQKRAVEKSLIEIHDAISQQKQQLTKDLHNTFIELEKTRDEGLDKLTNAQRNAREAAYEKAQKEATTRFLQAQIKIIEDQMTLLQEKMKTSKGRALAIAQKVYDELQSEVAGLTQQLPSIAVVQLPGKGSQQQQTKFLSYLNSLKTRLQAVKAKLTDTGTELAKVMSKLANGEFGDRTDQERAKIVAAAEELDKYNKKWKDHVKVTSGISTVTSSIKSLDAVLVGLNTRAETVNNPWIKLAGAASTADVKIKEFRATLEKLKGNADAKQLEQINALLQKVDELAPKATGALATRGLEGIKKALDDFTASEMNNADAAKYNYNIQSKYLDELIQKAGTAFGPDALNTIAQYRDALKRMAELNGNSLKKMLDEWRKDSSDWTDIWASMVSGMADELTNFIVNGKLDMQKFLTDIEEMIIKSQIQGAIAQIFSFIGGGGQTGSQFNNVPLGNGSTGTTATSAMGNVVGPWGVATLQKYAKGGIARKPMVSVFGEGSQPEAYVPLPDGRSIPVSFVDKTSSSKQAAGADVTVNVINQTAQPVDAQSSGPRFDGERYIVDVVLKNLTRPGRLRDTVKGTK